MTQKNAIYKVDNGVDFDEIYFKTIASQVNISDGRNLETLLQGAQTDVTGSGNDEICMRVPGGGIIQGTFNTIFDSDGSSKKIWFPKTFPNKCITVVTRDRYIPGCSGEGFMALTEIGKDGFSINPLGNTSRKIEWIAIGY